MAFYPVAPKRPAMHLYAGASAFTGKTVCGRTVTNTIQATTHFGSVTCRMCNGKGRR